LSSPDSKNARSRKALDLQRYVPALVTLLSTRLTNSGSTIYRKRLGIGATEMRVIVILAAERNISGNRIGAMTGTDKALVSRALKSLEALKLITVSADPTHGRRQSIALTRAGERVHEQGLAISLQREDLLLKGFSRQERELAVELLNRMVVNLPALETLAEG
jgi:DNA-binding MarR family transcriptional regulator